MCFQGESMIKAEKIKSVVITGANGFVGSWLCKKFSDNKIDVFAIVRNENSDISNIDKLPQVKVIYCDLENIKLLPQLIPEEKVDLFYHLAWEGAGGDLRSNYSVQLNNVRYTCDCVEVASKLKCKKILVSGTVSEHIAANYKEIKNISPNIIYGACKKFALELLDIQCKKYNIPYVWMRIANVYGPNSNNGNIVEYTLKAFMNEEIPSYSPGDQYYDLIYIEDLANAMYLLSINSLTKNIYYIGSGEPQKLKDYILNMKDIYGGNSTVDLGSRPDEGVKYSKTWYEIEDLSNETGFETRTSFKSGITSTLNWMKRSKEYGI